MIKILESKKLIEKQLDDVLTGPVSGYNRTTVVQYLASYGLDVENTTFVKTDPSELKKDQNILFIFAMTGSKFNPETHERTPQLYYRTCLYAKGKKQFAGTLRKQDDYVDRNGNILPGGNKDLSNASFKFLVTYCYAAYVLDDELVWSADKRKQRQDAKKGSIERRMTGAGEMDFYTGDKIDKSGYVIEKDKYRKMLATIHKDAYRKYFDEAIDLYNAVTEKLESDIKKSMSLDADPDTKHMLYSDQKLLQSFIGDIKSNLINFAAQFRRNNAQYLVMYADFLKRNLEKYRQPVKDILSKYN